MSRRRGASSIRVKREIVEILKQFPDGLTSPVIKAELKKRKMSQKACPTGVQLGQMLRGTLGVSRIGDVYEYAGETKVKYALWALTDLDKFEAWEKRRLD
jgi:hypothetical protein|tara:strand:+ start:792 stop:1091 length:300 start_codon:yes stop_codon:yes gene_type:complete